VIVSLTRACCRLSSCGDECAALVSKLSQVLGGLMLPSVSDMID